MNSHNLCVLDMLYVNQEKNVSRWNIQYSLFFFFCSSKQNNFTSFFFVLICPLFWRPGYNHFIPEWIHLKTLGCHSICIIPENNAVLYSQISSNHARTSSRLTTKIVDFIEHDTSFSSKNSHADVWGFFLLYIHHQCCDLFFHGVAFCDFLWQHYSAWLWMCSI